MTNDKPTILVVDDDKNTRDGLERALRRRYDVVLAEHGERALAILAAQHVDIILSDVRMPGMDGLTLLQRALAHRPNVICILLTAYGNVEVAVEAMKRGAYDFLTKPFDDLADVSTVVQRAAEKVVVQGLLDRFPGHGDKCTGDENCRRCLAVVGIAHVRPGTNEQTAAPCAAFVEAGTGSWLRCFVSGSGSSATVPISRPKPGLRRN